MRRMLTWLWAAVVPFAGSATTIRFFLGYSDQRIVNYALESGADPGAAIGKEIPTGSILRVPASNVNEGVFTVGYFLEYSSGTASWIRNGGTVFHIAYDSALSGDGEWNPLLDATSFRKLTYAFSDRTSNLTNFSSFPAWQQNGNPVDLNGDGIQDLATITPAGVRTYGSFGPGITVRPIGLGGELRADILGVGTASLHLHLGQPLRLCDVAFRTQMVAGESYGTGSGETGLNVLCDAAPPTGGGSNWIAPSAGLSFTGSKYNLLAVPEPSSLLVLGLGLLALRRRR